MKYRAFIPLLLLLGSSAAYSADQSPVSDTLLPQRLTAQEMLYACNSSALTSSGRERRQYCAGFISGVEEGIRLLFASGDITAEQKICMPSDVTTRDLRMLYTRYAATHEQILEKPAAMMALQALRMAYPCHAKKSN